MSKWKRTCRRLSTILPRGIICMAHFKIRLKNGHIMNRYVCMMFISLSDCIALPNFFCHQYNSPHILHSHSVPHLSFFDPASFFQPPNKTKNNDCRVLNCRCRKGRQAFHRFATHARRPVTPTMANHRPSSRTPRHDARPVGYHRRRRPVACRRTAPCDDDDNYCEHRRSWHASLIDCGRSHNNTSATVSRFSSSTTCHIIFVLLTSSHQQSPHVHRPIVLRPTTTTPPSFRRVHARGHHVS